MIIASIYEDLYFYYVNGFLVSSGFKGVVKFILTFFALKVMKPISTITSVYEGMLLCLAVVSNPPSRVYRSGHPVVCIAAAKGWQIVIFKQTFINEAPCRKLFCCVLSL